MTKANKVRESDIQKSILDYLRYKQIFCWKNNTTGIYVRSRDTYIPSQSVGSPDIFAVKNGKIYGIEVKAPKGVQSPSQQEFQKNFERAGGVYFIATSIEDVMNIL